MNSRRYLAGDDDHEGEDVTKLKIFIMVLVAVVGFFVFMPLFFF
jgi:hypothetical protein